MTIFINNKSTNFFVKLHYVLKDLFIKEKWFLSSALRCMRFFLGECAVARSTRGSSETARRVITLAGVATLSCCQDDARVKRDCKTGHHFSVDWLRDAIARITLVSNTSRQAVHGTGCRIPRSWYSVLRCMADAKSVARPPSALAPFLMCDELRSLARNCDVPPSQV